MKDDTLGLGAKIIQKQSDECTGLDAFKDLLGRLNGKSEETLDKERQIRAEIKTNLVIERKYGPMRFVSGGLLVGDHIKMAELVDNKSASIPTSAESTSGAADVESAKKEKREKKDKKSKKRKASEPEEDDTSDGKREKKRKKRVKVDEELGDNYLEVGKSIKKGKDRKEKKEKKLRRSKKAFEEEDTGPIEPETKRKKSKKLKDTPQPDSTETTKDATTERTRKKDKKRDKKQKQADSIDVNGATAATESSITTPATPLVSGSSTPSNTATSATQALSARHLSRSRYIASKRLAFGDARALNQVREAFNPFILARRLLTSLRSSWLSQSD